MKCLVTISAEEKIKEAAIKVFLEKGFDGTTTRDIAKEAGLNIALMNYYFRSKEKLFSSVFEEMLRLFFQGVVEIVNQPISLKEKLFKMIDHDFEMFKRTPGLSNFILNELHRNPERFLEATLIDKICNHSIFHDQLNEAIEKGQIRPMNFMHILLLLASNVQFIFHNKVMTTQIWKMTDDDFDKFAENHKEIVKQMIAGYLFDPVLVT